MNPHAVSVETGPQSESVGERATQEGSGFLAADLQLLSWLLQTLPLHRGETTEPALCDGEGLPLEHSSSGHEGSEKISQASWAGLVLTARGPWG